MKISFSTFACPQWDLESILTAAVRYGYNGVELRCDAEHHHGAEVTTLPTQRRELRSRMIDAGVELCCLATGLQFAQDWAVDQTRSRMELAADLGCPALRVFCGKPLDELSKPQMIETVGRQLREAIELNQYTGVQLWLETHDVFAHAADAAAAVRVANHPGVGLVYDNLHPFRCGEPLDVTLEAIQSLVRYVHFHDGLNRPQQVIIRPFGQGQLPLKQMFQGLLNVGFDGFVCGEWFHTMYGQDPDDSLEAYYRDITTMASHEGLVLGL